MSFPYRFFADFMATVGLLTAIPVPTMADARRTGGRILAWAPAVGILLGGMTAIVAWLLLRIAAPATTMPLKAGLVLAVGVALTGGLHLDGWADCCDGLLPPVSRERRRQIMKDPHAGSFAVIGLVLLLLVKASAVYALLGGVESAGVGRSLALLLAAPVCARWAMVLAAWTCPLASREGMGAFFRGGLGWRQVAVATAPMAVIIGVTGVGIGLVALLMAALAVAIIAPLALFRLGGLSGDVYGAIVELAETMVLCGTVVAIGCRGV